jgi:hypothetical protein
MHDIYSFIVEDGLRSGRTPSFPTFDDGYRCALVVDAVLASHKRGGVWTRVGSGALAETR